MRQSAVIQRNWQSLIKPEKLEVEPGADPARTATIIAEPLERGFGMTLGNALRRILLSSLQGAAVTAVQIDGVLHEFSSIPGVREDVTDIVLNIKQLALRMHGEGPKRMTLTANGTGEVRAGQIQSGHDIDIMNPELVICTLDDGVKLGMEFTVNLGKGYQPSTVNRPEDAPIGLIPVDSIYSPVRRVSYSVAPTRVGQVTDYDKLLLTVETNGAVTPEDSGALAARILQDQLQLFINFDEPQQIRAEEPHDDLPFNRNLLGKGDALEWSGTPPAGPFGVFHKLRRAAADPCRRAARRPAVQPQPAAQGRRVGVVGALRQLPEERQHRLYRRPGAEDRT